MSQKIDLTAMIEAYAKDGIRIMEGIAALDQSEIVVASLAALASYGRVYHTLVAGLKARGLGDEVAIIEDQIANHLAEAQAVDMTTDGERFVMKGGEA